MCSVTIIPLNKGGFRLACNRDELRNRPVAHRPEVFTYEPHQAIHPVDPVSEGTWIAVNDAGVALTLLNTNPPGEQAPEIREPISRGSIIPKLLHCDSAKGAIAAAQSAVDPEDHLPFRLIAVDGNGVQVLRSDSRSLTTKRHTVNRAPLFTSSSLGDDMVEEARQNLFLAMLRKGPNPQKQDSFHCHRWPSQPHLSVCMERDDARTVSYSIVSVGQDAISLLYHDGPPNKDAPMTDLMLPRCTGALQA